MKKNIKLYRSSHEQFNSVAYITLFKVKFRLRKSDMNVLYLK